MTDECYQPDNQKSTFMSPVPVAFIASASLFTLIFVLVFEFRNARVFHL